MGQQLMPGKWGQTPEIGIQRVKSSSGGSGVDKEALQWGPSHREVGRGAELKGRRGNSVLRTWVWGAKNREYWREAGEGKRRWQGGPGVSSSGELWRSGPGSGQGHCSGLVSVQDRGCSGALPSPSWSFRPSDFPPH